MGRGVRTQFDGVWFDSKGEAERAAYLKMLEKAGQIVGLEWHPETTLIVNGVEIGKYTADYRYFKITKEGRRPSYEDWKGFVDTAAALRIKIFCALHPEITFVKSGPWKTRKRKRK